MRPVLTLAMLLLLGSPSWGQAWVTHPDGSSSWTPSAPIAPHKYDPEPTLAPTQLTGQLYVSPVAPPEGTVFASRNSEKVGNRKPDQWNHTAVMGPNGYVIENQQGRGVLAVPFATFYRRYPVILAFRVAPLSKGSAIAAAAVSQLGQPYRLLRDNCVDVVRRSVNLATHTKRAWDRPDQVARDRLQVLWKKDARQGWVESPAPFEGATDSPEVVLKSEKVLHFEDLEIPKAGERIRTPSGF